MQIKEMFKKSITRDIQGVVIAGQGEKTNVATELEEYVVHRNCSGILQISSLHTQKESTVRPPRWACGFPASSEVVNLTC